LFGQDGTDEPNDRGPVGEDPDHVGAATDLAVGPLVGMDQIWRQTSLGNAVKARMSARAPSRWSATAGSFSDRASTTHDEWAEGRHYLGVEVLARAQAVDNTTEEVTTELSLQAITA